MSFQSPVLATPVSVSNKAASKMIISPTAQRVLSLTSPSTLLLMNDGKNDDAEEIRKRRRSVMIEKQQQSNNVNSPSIIVDKYVSYGFK